MEQFHVFANLTVKRFTVHVQAKRYTLHAVVTYNIFLPRSFVLAQGSLASCRIINNLVQEMLQVITVHTVSSLLGWQKKARIASDLFKILILPLHSYISFHFFTILFPLPIFFVYETGEIRDSKLVFFSFLLEKFRVWMQIKTCEYEFIFAQWGIYICITWIQNSRGGMQLWSLYTRNWSQQIRLIWFIWLYTFPILIFLLFRIIFKLFIILRCWNFIQSSIKIYEHLNKCCKNNFKKKTSYIMNTIKILWKWIRCI